MQIVGFVGPPGAGKTATAVYVAYKMHRRGRNVVTNVCSPPPGVRVAAGKPNHAPGLPCPSLAFPHVPLPAPKVGKDGTLPWDELEHAVVLLDEIHVWLDSRNSSTKLNRVVSYVLTQSRKRDVDILYTSQFFHMVEKRVRDLTTGLVECENLGDWIRLRMWKAPIDTLQRPKLGLLRHKAVWSLYDTNKRIMLPGLDA